MIDELLALVPEHGAWLLAVVVGLGCLGVPIPSSLALIMAGGLIASGDMSAPTVLAAGLAGAVAGDVLGYVIGRLARHRIDAAAALKPARQQALDRAKTLVRRWGGPSVFFTRWLISPLGPAVNVAAGAAGLSPGLFLLGDLAGEMVWVLLYVLAGYVLTEQAAAWLPLVSDSAALIVAALVTLGLGVMLMRRLRATAAST